MQDDGLKMSPEDELELYVTQALERLPKVRIAEDFAARVVSRLPESPKTSLGSFAKLRQTRYGYTAAVTCMILLLTALVLLAPQIGTHDRILSATVGIVVAQFVLLAAWLSVSRWGQQSRW